MPELRTRPGLEIHSVDESCLDLPDLRPAHRMPLARDMRETVPRRTGIPTHIVIGATTTSAELAEHLARKVPELGRFRDPTDPARYDH